MAVTFDLPDGTATDIVALTLPVFFVRTPEDFLEFTRVRKPDPETGQPDFAKVGPFIEAHPEVLPAIQAALGAKAPASYLECAYNGLHAFRLVNAAGDGTWIRWTFEPTRRAPGSSRAMPPPASPTTCRPTSSSASAKARRASRSWRCSRRTATRWTTRRPPGREDRERVAIGRLEITGLAFDREQDGDILVFDPTRVVDGIECSDDPILHARSWAYSESVLRRTGVERGF